MLIIFAIACSGDTSADGSANQHYIHDYRGRIVQIIRHCADDVISGHKDQRTFFDYIKLSSDEIANKIMEKLRQSENVGNEGLF